MKDINTLIPDIYELFDPDTPHEVDEDNLTAFTDVLKEVIRQRLKEREKTGGALRFSNLGRPDRQVWMAAHPEPGTEEKLTSKTYLKFLYGDVIEALILFLATEAGHLVTDQQKEVEADGVLGHIDAKIDGHVVDVKSASPFGFRKFKDNSIAEDDPFGYVQQLAGYASEETPDEGAYWLAMDKVAGTLALTSLSASVVKDNAPRPRIAHLREVIDQPTPPPHCYSPVPDGKSGNLKLPTGCSYCPFKRRCFPEVRTFLYSTGPRYLTRVMEEPRVLELIAGTPEDPEVTD